MSLTEAISHMLLSAAVRGELSHFFYNTTCTLHFCNGLKAQGPTDGGSAGRCNVTHCDFLTRALRGLTKQFVAKHSQMLFASKAKAIAEIHKTNVSMINLVILENSVQSQQMLLTE